MSWLKIESPAIVTVCYEMLNSHKMCFLYRGCVFCYTADSLWCVDAAV